MRLVLIVSSLVLFASLACEPAPPDDVVQNPPAENPPVIVVTPPPVVEPPVDQVVVNPPATDPGNLPGQGTIDSGIPVDDDGEEVIN